VRHSGKDTRRSERKQKPEPVTMKLDTVQRTTAGAGVVTDIGA
jgi:hypothetical protein